MGKEEIVKLSNKELQQLWEVRKNELFEIRKELDRRKGVKNPVTNVDLADGYLTD